MAVQDDIREQRVSQVNLRSMIKTRASIFTNTARQSFAAASKVSMFEMIASHLQRWLRWALCLALIGGLIVVVAVSHGQNQRQVDQLFTYISPRPGARYVSPGTTIALRSQQSLLPRLAESVSFSVIGSASGRHSGETVLATDGETLIFRPDNSFWDDETVRVRLNISAASQGEDTSEAVEYQFHISAAEAPPSESELDVLLLPDKADAQSFPAPTRPLTTTPPYVTAPADIPTFQVFNAPPGTDEGYIFLGHFKVLDYLNGIAYLFILDNNGEPVYYENLAPVLAALDFKLQPNGQLTYFNPMVQNYIALDSTYTQVDTYQAGNGYVADQHDLQILPDGSALLLIYDSQVVDMSVIVPGGDPQALVVGCLVQIVDPADNVVFEWSSWDHISILESNQDLTASFIDYVHCNSVENDLDGNILLSSRHLDEVTKINRSTGDIIWRLGPHQSDFDFVNDPGFFFQHDARRLTNGHITVFDNRSSQTPAYSRAVEYALDPINSQAIKVWEYRNTPDTVAPYMGNHQRLPNGSALIGWGASGQPAVTEVTSNGTKVFELGTAPAYGSYRAFRFSWQGYPTWPPLLLAQVDGSDISLFFSWNGATEIDHYKVFGGRTPDPTDLIAVLDKDGFETSLVRVGQEDGLHYFRIMPVDKNGADTRYSNTYVVAINGSTTYLPLIR